MFALSANTFVLLRVVQQQGSSCETNVPSLYRYMYLYPTTTISTTSANNMDNDIMGRSVEQSALLAAVEECVLRGGPGTATMEKVRVATFTWRLSRGTVRDPGAADVEQVVRALQGDSSSSSSSSSTLPEVFVVSVNSPGRVSTAWRTVMWEAVLALQGSGVSYKETAVVERGGAYLCVFTRSGGLTPRHVSVGGFSSGGRQNVAAKVTFAENGGTMCFANWAFPRRTKRHMQRERAYYTHLALTSRCLGIAPEPHSAFPLSLPGKSAFSSLHPDAGMDHLDVIGKEVIAADPGLRGAGGEALGDGAVLLNAVDYLYVTGALESRLLDGRDQLSRSMQHGACFAGFTDVDPEGRCVTSYLDASRTYPGDVAAPLKPAVPPGRTARTLIYSNFLETFGSGGTPPKVLLCRSIPFGKVQDRPLFALTEVLVLKGHDTESNLEARMRGVVRRVNPGRYFASKATLGTDPDRYYIHSCGELPPLPDGVVGDARHAAYAEMTMQFFAAQGLCRTGASFDEEIECLSRMDELDGQAGDCALSRRGVEVEERKHRERLVVQMQQFRAYSRMLELHTHARNSPRRERYSSIDDTADVGFSPRTHMEDLSDYPSSAASDAEEDVPQDIQDQRRSYETASHNTVAPAGYVPRELLNAFDRVITSSPIPATPEAEAEAEAPSTALGVLVASVKKNQLPLNPDVLFDTYDPPTPPMSDIHHRSVTASPVQSPYIRADKLLSAHTTPYDPATPAHDEEEEEAEAPHTEQAAPTREIDGYVYTDGYADPPEGPPQSTPSEDTHPEADKQRYYSPAYYLPPWFSLLWSVAREAYAQGKVETCSIEHIAMASLSADAHWDMLHERGLLAERCKGQIRERELQRREEREMSELQPTPHITRAAKVLPSRGQYEFYRYTEDWKNRAMVDREQKERLQEEAALAALQQHTGMSANSRRILKNSMRREALAGDGYKSPVAHWDYHAYDYFSKKLQTPGVEGTFEPVINPVSYKLGERERDPISVRMQQKVKQTEKKLSNKRSEQLEEEKGYFKPETSEFAKNLFKKPRDPEELANKLYGSRKKFDKAFATKKRGLQEEECPFKPAINEQSTKIMDRKPPQKDIGTRSVSKERGKSASPRRKKFSAAAAAAEAQFAQKKMTEDDLIASGVRLCTATEFNRRKAASKKKVITSREDDVKAESNNATFRPQINPNSRKIAEQKEAARRQHLMDNPPSSTPEPSSLDPPPSRQPSRQRASRSVSPSHNSTPYFANSAHSTTRPITTRQLLQRPRPDTYLNYTGGPTSPGESYKNSRGGSMGIDGFMEECGRMGVGRTPQGEGERARSVSGGVAPPQYFTPLRSAAGTPWGGGGVVSSVRSKERGGGGGGGWGEESRTPSMLRSGGGGGGGGGGLSPSVRGTPSHRDAAAMEFHLSSMCGVLDEYRSLEDYASSISLSRGRQLSSSHDESDV